MVKIQDKFSHKKYLLLKLCVEKLGFKWIKVFYRNKFIGGKVWSLISYPKCGRTWLRFMLCQSVSLHYDIPLINAIHEVRYKTLSVPRVGFSHKVIFQNDSCDFTLDIKNLEARNKGIILLVREPARVMISFFHQCKYREGFYTGNFSNFIRHPVYGVESYVRYLDFNLSQVKKTNYLIVKYERLKSETFEQLKKILDFTDLLLPDNLIREIVRRSSFEEMKLIEKSNQYNIGWLRPSSKSNLSSKVRSGGKESLEEYFSSEDLTYLENVVSNSETLKDLGYCENS